MWLTGRANTTNNLLLGENKMLRFYVYSPGGVGGGGGGGVGESERFVFERLFLSNA